MMPLVCLLVIVFLMVIIACTVVMTKDLKEDFVIKMGNDTDFHIELAKQLIPICLCTAVGLALFFFLSSEPIFLALPLISSKAIINLILTLSARKQYKKNQK